MPYSFKYWKFKVSHNKIVLLFLFLPFILLAQKSHEIDSLHQEIKKWERKEGWNADTALYSLYFQLGERLKGSNPDTALYFLEKSILYAKKIKDELKVAESIKVKGVCYHLKSDYSKALSQYNLSLSVLERYLQSGASEDTTSEIKARNLQATNLGNIGVLYKNQGELSKALEFYHKALEINEKTGNLSGQAINLGNIGNIYREQGNYSKALEYYFKAQKIDEDLQDYSSQSANLGNIAIVYQEQGDYARALDYYFKALKIDEKIGHQEGQAINLGNIGNIYKDQNNYSKAIEYYLKALAINKTIGNKKNQAVNLGNLGIVYKNQNQYAKALDYYFQALKINEEIGNKRGLALNYINIGNVYRDATPTDYTKALEYYFQALGISEETGNQSIQAISLGSIGLVYLKKKNYSEAYIYLQKAIAIGEKLKIIYHLKDFYAHLSKLYEETGRYKEALEAYKKHIMHTDSLNRAENQKAIATKEMQYQHEKEQERLKNEQKLKELKAAEEKNRIQIVLASVSIILGLVIIAAIMIYRSLQITKKQKHIIEIQKKEIENKNQNILDSIAYAKRIQEAILPSSKKWQTLLPNSFVLYMPKDIVAGDFYWLEEDENYLYVAAADCTGHGVPGAMVSVVCSNALSEAVKEDKETETNKILDRVRELVVDRLSGSSEEIRDGMDICLIRINKQNPHLVQYSGANISLQMLHHDGKLEEIKADRQPIGRFEKGINFQKHEIELQAGDTLYLITDGYRDQFEEKTSKKIGATKLKELLVTIGKEDIARQPSLLKEYFENHRGTRPQMDDVTILGIKV